MNIYKKYRKMSGITQEKASEYLGISVDSLKRYENGERVPNNDIARKMCLTYGDMRLAYEHLENSQLGELVLAPLQEKDICCSAMGFLNELNNILDKRNDLIKITADGVISDDESLIWNELEKSIKRLITSSFEVIYRR